MSDIKGGSFKSLHLNTNLFHNIKFKSPSPIQRKAIPPLLNNQNIVGIARTGSGKTLAYLIPAIEKYYKKQSTVIVVPTRELVFQVQNFLSELCDIKPITIFGNKEVDLRNKGHADAFIIIGTVGAIAHSGISKTKSNFKSVDFLVLDEADRIFDDNTMTDDYEIIKQDFQPLQYAFFSATISGILLQKAPEFNLIRVDPGLSNTLSHTFLATPASLKISVLERILQLRNGKSIIFCATKYGVELLLAKLRDDNKLNVSGIYGSLDQDLRESEMNDFKSNRTSILIVTDLAARGLDIPELDFVVNFDICDVTTFVHRVGRVARNGRPGEQISLVSFTERYLYSTINTHLGLNGILYSVPTMGTKIDENLNRMAKRALIKAKKFIKGESCAEEINFDNLAMHPMFEVEKEKEDFINMIRRRRNKENVENIIEKKNFKDQFYIPYRSADLPLIAPTLQDDDSIRRKKIKNERRKD